MLSKPTPTPPLSLRLLLAAGPRKCPNLDCPDNWEGPNPNLARHLRSNPGCKASFLGKVGSVAGEICTSMDEVASMVKKGGLGKSLREKRKLVLEGRFARSMREMSERVRRNGGGLIRAAVEPRPANRNHAMRMERRRHYLNTS